VIIDLPSTTTSKVNSKLVELRDEGGATTLGRVLTLVIVTDDGEKADEALDAANHASREHPCRVLVVARGAKKAAPRLDAQLRVGGDAGASEVVVLRLYGALADEGASCVEPLLLPDAPIVAWWPHQAPPEPAKDPIGQIAHRRITDAAADRNPIRTLEQRRKSYTPGDTDLAWTRLTNWRALLAAALDLPPHEKVINATVAGEGDSPSTELLAGWLAARLRVPVTRTKATYGGGIVSVVLERRSGNVELERPDEKVGTLIQPGQPERKVALRRRPVRECLSEELRRLDPDEIYEVTLHGLSKVVRGRAGSGRSTAKTNGSKATSKTTSKTTSKAAGSRRTSSKTTGSGSSRSGTESSAGTSSRATATRSRTTRDRSSARADSSGADSSEADGSVSTTSSTATNTAPANGSAGSSTTGDGS
jgi:glucose-6-phosphate dehydrogenase assembly protein OpcA